VLKALRVISAGQARAAIALPDNYYHRVEVDLVRIAIRQLGIVMFWVRDDGSVKR
jgi:hypothetical protein